jgi:hydroxybutyrate-dimer hydrolase
MAGGVLVCGTLLAGCASVQTRPADTAGTVNVKPAFASQIVRSSYDGVTDDLLTAGLGRTGLALATPPVLSAVPTAAELRRLAIHSNYRAIVDTTPGGGFGTLFGPSVDVRGLPTPGEGKIAGHETLAYADDGSGRQKVTMLVQVPTGFDPQAPCLVSATSSGSRGVYGAIGSAGEWGLKHGCAVAYVDKGSGNGVHDLQADTINLIDGRRGPAAAAGEFSNFTAALSDAQRSSFNSATPNRFAVKHAHSQQNPERDWGRQTLQAIEFAFWVLNEQYGTPLGDGRRARRITKSNTVVIASSISNGAGSALAAAELDRDGLIDGVAVSEPNVQLPPGPPVRIERGSAPAYTAGSRPLFDFFSYANLLQPCAALASGAVGSPFAFNPVQSASATQRCAALAANGLISGSSPQQQADDALARLQAYGWESDAALLHASHFLFASPAIAVTYANAYGRFSVADNLCGFSFAAVDAAGAPVVAPEASLAAVFGTGSGVPPSGFLQLVYNASVGGARSATLATSPSTGQKDFAFDGALCLRQLWSGSTPQAQRVKAGVAEVQRTADLHGKPALIVHGRSDTLVPVNFSSRPYLVRNNAVEGGRSRLRYVEVTNAQHFDAFLPLAGYDSRFVPLHLYFIRALDAMWAHLKQGAPLPVSQVVHTTPRGGAPGAAVPLTAANVPPIVGQPPAADRIVIDGSTLRVPQ